MILQLAWRNIWRNPRRTAVILMAVIIGVWSMIVLGALMRGMIMGAVENRIATLTGAIQVHLQGYRSDPVVENSMASADQVRTVLEADLPAGAAWTSRVRVNAIAGNARHSRGVTLVGIEPKREPLVSFFGPEAISEGRYLEAEDPNGIVVGRALLEDFDTRLGHKLVLMSQDTGGEVASRAFRIVGTFRADMEIDEKRFVFVSLSAARRMLNLEGISEISIALPDIRRSDRVAARIRAALPPEYEVSPWRDLLPLLTAQLDIFEGFIYIWYVVVFIAMGFGIVNTTLMAIFERMREFGLFKAMGMGSRRIVTEVLTESFYLLILGMTIGNLAGFLSVFGLSRTGINLSALAEGTEYFGLPRVVYPLADVVDVSVANLVVLVLGLLVSLYPAAKAARFTPVEALTRT